MCNYYLLIENFFTEARPPCRHTDGRSLKMDA